MADDTKLVKHWTRGVSDAEIRASGSPTRAIFDRLEALALQLSQRDAEITRLQGEIKEREGERLPDAFVTCTSDAPKYYVTIKTPTLKDAHAWHDAVIGLARVGR